MTDLIKGKYRIVREIARSNDIVYEALDINLGRRIALKVLNFPPNLVGQERRDRIERFNREARASGRLSHPNIVSVSDFGEENGNYFIVMEYLEGQTLRDMIAARGALQLKEAVDIACQVLSALEYAHVNRVIHRDVKPDNIFILQGSVVKLTDFGIARLTEESNLTSDGQVFGTPSYMSPEQIVGKGIDYRSDLFSLGVVLYEMLLGRKPFTGDSVVSITYAVMNAEPPNMLGVPMSIEQVVRRALSKNPMQRQASADQMRQELRTAEQNPSLFTSSLGLTGSGVTGMGGQSNYGQISGSYGQGMGYPSPLPSVAYPAYPPPTVAPPAAQPQQNGLPWAWNSSNGTVSAPASGTAPPLPMNGAQPSNYGAGGPLTAAGGIFPYASPPFPARPPEPLFVISPGVKRFLQALAAAIVIGSVAGFGVVAFMNRYADYQVQVQVQHVANLMGQAEGAYNSADYVTAAKMFEQALGSNPTPDYRSKILTELGYSYVHLAQSARGKGDLAEAKSDYEKALNYNPNYDLAHSELSALLESMGDHEGAQAQQNSIIGTGSHTDLPQKLSSSTTTMSGSQGPSASSGGSAGAGADPNQFLQSREDEAKELLSEGDALDQQGRHKDAEEKWRQALEKGFGLPESDEATKRLEKSNPTQGG